MEEGIVQFDVQRFASAAAGGSEAGGEASVAAFAGEAGEAESAADLLAIPSRLGLKDGQLRYIEDAAAEGGDGEGDDEPAESEAGLTEEQAVAGDAGAEQLLSVYSPQELALGAADIASLDPARIPPVALPLYQALVAKVEAERQEPVPEASGQAGAAEAEQQLFAQALAKVHETLQRQGEAYDEFNPAHQALHMLEISRFERQLARDEAKRQVEQQAQLQARQKVYSQIEVRARALAKQAGADFAGVDTLAETHLHSLPYGKASPIAAAIGRLNGGQATEADIPVLEGYWEECRREYFAKKTGVSKEPKPIPPQMLRPGSDREAKERFDAREIGKMDQEARIEYYKRTGFADRLANLG